MKFSDDPLPDSWEDIFQVLQELRELAHEYNEHISTIDTNIIEGKRYITRTVSYGETKEEWKLRREEVRKQAEVSENNGVDVNFGRK